MIKNPGNNSSIRYALVFIGFLIMASFTSTHQPSQMEGKEILHKMDMHIDKIKTLKFRLKKKERVDNKISAGEQLCKYQHSPKKIYTKIISPNQGVEILYLEGENKGKALVNPNGFPYISISLDPFSSTMRKNNHHTIHEVGFDYINSVVSSITKKHADKLDEFVLYQGDTVVNNRKCFKVLIDYTDFKYYSYKVKPGENITDIAYRLFISDYMILQINNLADYTSVKPGQIIKIPNAYARKTFLYIDKENFLPILQIMHDDRGLFAEYSFVNLELNPIIKPEEFSRDYKEYNF